MRISALKSDRDNRPVTVDITPEQLAERLGQCRDTECQKTTRYLGSDGAPIETPAIVCPSLTPHPVTGERLPNKCTARAVEAWSPAVFDGNGRTAANVVGMGAIVLDVDHVTTAELARVGARVEELGWWCVLHSTHSHNPARDDNCLRLVFLPECELTVPEITPTRDWVQSQLGLRADEQTTDHGRLYYAPTRPKDGPARMFAHAPGTFIVPVTVLGADVARTHVSPLPVSSRAVLFDAPPVDLADLRKRVASGSKGELFVREMLDGEPLAKSGGRDNAINKLSGHLAFSYGDVSIEALLELMRPSLAAMEPPESGDWLEVARDKLERAQARFLEQEADKARLSNIAYFHNLQSAKRAAGTDPRPVTPDIEAEWAKSQGCTPEEWTTRWIIRYHGGNWIWCHGRYSAALEDKDLDFSIQRDFAGTTVELWGKNPQGDNVPLGYRKIWLKHSSVARACMASISLRHSYYDPSEQCFHEAVCPIRYELEPVEHPEINEWLRLFGGDVLLDWVAAVTKLDKPAAALYIDGPKGTGKNVLADGLARLWHKGGATSFKDVIGTNFNDAITRCPLIHADEGIPKTDTVIDDLRRLIGSSTQSLNRKFMPTVPLHGNARLIITANNDRVLLDTGAQLGPNDIDAVTERIRQLKAGPDAAPYLASFRKTHGHQHIQEWVRGDHVARHALWLAANRKIDESKRFLVSGEDSAQAEAMTTGTAMVSSVLEFLCRALSTPAYTSPKIRAGDGVLLVNTEALADEHAWKRFVPSRKIPAARVISDSLRAISEREAVTVDDIDYFAVKPRIVINWARTNQVGAWRLMEKRIGSIGTTP